MPYRDFYPSLWLLPVAVGPFSRGDTPLQAYNQLFSLQHMNHFADGVLHYENDDLARRVPSPESRFNFTHMNTAVASDLSAALFPRGARQFDFGRALSSLTRPSLRLIDLRSARSSASGPPVDWGDLAKQCLGPTRDDDGRAVGVHATFAVVRGRQDSRALPSVRAVVERSARAAPGHPEPFGADCDNGSEGQTVALMSTRSSHACRIRRLLSSAAVKYLAGAYVHWYEKYGIERDDFAAAFESVGEIVSAYDDLGGE